MNELTVLGARALAGAAPAATVGSSAASGAGSLGSSAGVVAANRGEVAPVSFGGAGRAAIRDEAEVRQQAIEPTSVVPESSETADLRSTLADEPLSLEIEKVVESINSFLQSSRRSLEFSVDENSGRTVITVFDSERKTVIRQIPPETAINIMQRIQSEGRADDTGFSERA